MNKQLLEAGYMIKEINTAFELVIEQAKQPNTESSRRLAIN